MLLKICLLSTAIALALCTGYINTGISQPVVNSILSENLPSLGSYFNGIPLGQASLSSGTFSNILVGAWVFDPTATNITINNGSLTFVATNVETSFSYQNGTQTYVATASASNFTFVVTASLVPNTASSPSSPTNIEFNFVNTTLFLNNFMQNFEGVNSEGDPNLQGSLITSFVNYWSGTVPPALSSLFNALFAPQPIGTSPLSIDFSVVNVEFIPGSISFSHNGSVFMTNLRQNFELTPEIVLPTISAPTTGAIEFYISQNVLKSALYSYWSSQQLTFTQNYEFFNTAVPLTANYLSSIWPDLATIYGESTPAYISCSQDPGVAPRFQIGTGCNVENQEAVVIPTNVTTPNTTTPPTEGETPVETPVETTTVETPTETSTANSTATPIVQEEPCVNDIDGIFGRRKAHAWFYGTCNVFVNPNGEWENALSFTGNSYVGAEIFLGGAEAFFQVYTVNMTNVTVVSSNLTSAVVGPGNFEDTLTNLLMEGDDVWYLETPVPTLPFQGNGSASLAVSNNGWVRVDLNAPWAFV